MSGRITLPVVTKETMKQITRPVLDFTNMDVNKEQLKQYISEIEEDNPEIVRYMGRATQMMDMVQSLHMDTSWFALVSMIIMYKTLEAQYAKKMVEQN